MKKTKQKTKQDCRACEYFVGCECFDGRTCDLFKKADRRRKLTDKQRAEIIKLYGEGEKQCALAKKYGVSNSTIGLVVNPWARADQNKRQRAWYLQKCKNLINKQRGEK